jgi:hypothetical protein
MMNKKTRPTFSPEFRLDDGLQKEAQILSALV